MTGWIRLYRDIQKHWIWQDDRYLRWWIIILLNVNYKATKFPVNFELHTCNPGQSFKSIENWSKLLGCSKKTTIRFLNLLESDRMISRKTIGKGNRRKHLLTVQNWKKYQDKSPETIPECTLNGNPGIPPNKKEEEELKKVFNICRKVYPGTKRGLDTEFENLKKKHQNWKELIPLFEPAIRKQIQYRENPPPGVFIPAWQNFQTWINQKSWEFELPINGQENKPTISSPKSIFTND